MSVNMPGGSKTCVKINNWKLSSENKPLRFCSSFAAEFKKQALAYLTTPFSTMAN